MRFRLHSKTPLPIVLGILLNLVLVILLEILLIYRHPTPLNSAAIADADPNLADCILLMEDTADRTQFTLVQRTDGRKFLIPSRVHPFVPTRSRIYTKEIKEVYDTVGTQAYRLGIRLYHVTAYPDYLLTSSARGSGGLQSTFTWYMTVSLVLTLVELGILGKIKGE